MTTRSNAKIGLAVALTVLGAGVTTWAVDIIRLEEGAVLRMRMSEKGEMQVTAGGAAPAMQVVQTGAGKLLALVDGSTERLTVRDGGNVGIGVTSPGQRLEVAGNIRLSGGRIMNVGAPTAASDVATKGYVDAAGGGGGGSPQFRRTNHLTRNPAWDVPVNVTGGGCLLVVRYRTEAASSQLRVTVDGVEMISLTSVQATNTYHWLDPVGNSISSAPVQAMNIPFKNSLKVEHMAAGNSKYIQTEVLYAN